MATTKEELLVLGVRHVVVTCHRGTSVARSLKLLPFFMDIESNPINQRINQKNCLTSLLAYSSRYPCDTNTDQWLNTQSTTEQQGSQQKRQSRAGVPYALIWNGSRRYCATLDLRKTSNRSVTEYWEIPSCVHHAEQPRLRRFGRVP